ncbi:DNA-3-methyladenine glycosylase family protein [Rhizobium alvei]|uniref:DNA-3-methyladenine glycosylase II n=1 Tax=Rhizobium alvei TaxID=1132659 RepID=A0ABT8YMU3_9HYPH|nr:DNA-3-methyladenine glycosylase 2 family protein [Rhizobium alvei]MDO6964821.1 DNA-3-methyladenine glycosylase 2 family protein [Rhizobium alvei]
MGSTLILNETDLADAIDRLIAAVPEFRHVANLAGTVPLRSAPFDYEGLAYSIVAQMVSRASADAIWRRLVAAVATVAPGDILALDDGAMRAIGLSGAKAQALRALAEACSGAIDFDELRHLPSEAAIARLSAVRGIGAWTAEVFLLFAGGHPDIFPAGDVALQAAYGHAFTLENRPNTAAMRKISAAWQPHRSAAARLLWAYYATCVRSDASPVAARQKT